MAHAPEPLGGRDALWALTIGVSALLVFLPIHDRWLGLLDEGYVLAIADEVNRGRVLYRDIWIDNPFPGAFTLLALWFRLAGTSVASSRLLTLAGFAVYASALFCFARALLPRRAALGFVTFVFAWRVWAFPHWQVHGYSLPAAAAVALAAAAAMAAYRRRSRALWLAAGVLFGCTTLCKQSYGLAVAATTGAALVALPFLEPPGRPRTRDVLAPLVLLGAGLLVALGPPLAQLAAQGALDDFVRQAIVQPLRGALGFHAYLRLPDLWPLHRQDAALRAAIGSYFPAILATVWWPSISASWLLRETPVWDAGLKLVYWAPVFTFAAATLVWGGTAAADLSRRRVDAVHGPRLLALALAGGFLLAFPPPRDWTHLMMVVPPQALLGAALLRDLTARLPGPAARTVRTACWAALALLLGATAALVRDFRRQMDFPLDGPRAGVFADRQNGPLLRDLLEHVERVVPPGVPVPIYPLQPMIGFLAGREPVGGFHVIWPVQDPGRDDRIIADLEGLRPPLVVYGLSQYALLGRFQENAPRLFDYLVAHYAIERVFSREPYGTVLATLTRRPDETGGTALRSMGGVEGARETRWPFADVLAVPVGPPGGATAAHARIDVPSGEARLVLAYGINPDRWLGLDAGPFTFSVTVAPAGDAPRTLLRRTIDPGREVADRRWHDATLDLSSFAGQRVDLALAVEVPGAPERPDDLAGFAEPRLLTGRSGLASPR